MQYVGWQIIVILFHRSLYLSIYFLLMMVSIFSRVMQMVPLKCPKHKPFLPMSIPSTDMNSMLWVKCLYIKLYTQLNMFCLQSQIQLLIFACGRCPLLIIVSYRDFYLRWKFSSFALVPKTIAFYCFNCRIIGSIMVNGSKARTWRRQSDYKCHIIFRFCCLGRFVGFFQLSIFLV